MDKPSEQTKRLHSFNEEYGHQAEQLELSQRLDRIAADNARVMEFVTALARAWANRRTEITTRGQECENSARRFLNTEQGKAEVPAPERPEPVGESDDTLRTEANEWLCQVRRGHGCSGFQDTLQCLVAFGRDALRASEREARAELHSERSKFWGMVEVAEKERDALKKDIDCGSNRTICNNPVKRCWACEVAYQKSLRQQGDNR